MLANNNHISKLLLLCRQLTAMTTKGLLPPPLPASQSARRIQYRGVRICYKQPADWLQGAQHQLEIGDFQQTSEKCYAAGRTAVDQLAEKGNIKLKTHKAANKFIQYIDMEQKWINRLEDFWSVVNGAHSNFYTNEMSEHRLQTVVSQIGKFAQLVGTFGLTNDEAERFFTFARENGLRVMTRDKKYPGMKVVY